MICFTTVLSLVAVAVARPQEQPAHLTAAAAPQGSGSTPIPIVSQTEEINPDGSFKFSYETGNGIKYEESGYLKDNGTNSEDKIQVIKGSVSYTDTDGKLINLKFTADENGFQPEGDHIPTPPEAAAGRSLQPGGQPAGAQAGAKLNDRLAAQPAQAAVQLAQAVRPAQQAQPVQSTAAQVSVTEPNASEGTQQP